MRRVALALALLVLALGAPLSAFAHAQLTGGVPAAGSVVPEAPATLRLDYNEPVSPISLAWVQPDGRILPLDARAEGAALVIPVPPETPRGTQTISWRAVSVDGHPIAGSYVFSIGAASTTAGTLPAPRDAAQAVVGARFLLTSLIVVGIGGLLFSRGIDPDQKAPPWTRRLSRAATLAIPIAALALLGAQGLDLAGLPANALLTPAPWITAIEGPSFEGVVCAALSGLLGALGFRAAALLAALSFALSGHAATAAPVWLTGPSMFLHGLALIFWLGALPPLLGWALSGRPDLGPALRRFSVRAIPLVALLIATGLVLSIVQVRHLPALFETGYGRILSAKLVCVLGLLLLALLNRYWLTPAIAAEKTAARRRLSHSLGTEIVLGLAVLLLASSFRLTPPPRALAALPAPVTYAHLQGGKDMAMLALTPGRAGVNSIRIGSMAGATPPREMMIAFSRPDLGIEPITIHARQEPDGDWAAGEVMLPVAGPWRISVKILIDDYKQTRLLGKADLSP